MENRTFERVKGGQGGRKKEEGKKDKKETSAIVQRDNLIMRPRAQAIKYFALENYCYDADSASSRFWTLEWTRYEI